MERSNFIGTFSSVLTKLSGENDNELDTHLYKISPIKINPKVPTEVTLTFHEDEESKILKRLYELSNELQDGGAVEFKMAAKSPYGSEIMRNIILSVSDIDITLTEFDYNCGDDYDSKIIVKITYLNTRVEVFDVEPEDEEDDDF